MIQITPRDRILVNINPIDFRCGIDALAGLCKCVLKEDPFSGTYFCFSNRGRTSVKILFYDRQGFWMFQKRFSSGKIPWWPGGDGQGVEVDPKKFLLLIYGAESPAVRFKEDWKK